MKLKGSAITVALLVLIGCGAAPRDSAAQPDAGETTPPPPEKVSVTISAAPFSVEAASRIQLSATVSGSTDSSVTWVASAGTIDQTGLFIAPTTLGEVEVKATSRADTTASAVMNLTVIARDVSSTYADKFDVIVDPYAINPLAAVANVRGLLSADIRSVNVNVKGDGTSPPFAIAYAPDSLAYHTNWDSSDVIFAQEGHHVPIIGLLPDVENQVEVLIDTQRGERITKRLTIATRMATDSFDPCRDCYPTVEVTPADTSNLEPGWTFIELNLGDAGRLRSRPIALDRSGRVRWILRLDYLGNAALGVSESLNGNILTGQGGSLYEFNRLGRVARAIPIPGYSQHHEVLEIKEGPRIGNLLVAADELGAATIEDRILEVNRATGRIVRKWDLSTILDPMRTTFINDSVDWLHNNGIAYSATDDTIVISGRHQGVAKIDQAGSLRWLLAPHRGWQGAQAARLLTATDASGTPYADGVQDGADNVGGSVEFDWTWGQHSPQVVSNGDVILFDNGFHRHFDPNSTAFSRAVIYRINEDAMTVRQIWEYGSARGFEYFSSIISSVTLLPGTGNFLIQPGITGRWGAPESMAIASEVASDGRLLFETRVRFANRNSSGPSGTGFDLSYRAHRIAW